ncbi:MAG: alpha/beta fold hydrolase [Solirubrobacterales bacterium]
MRQAEGHEFSVQRAELTLSGDKAGSGDAVVLLHGLTATRDVVVHGSRHLPRQGFELIVYDARGHGQSEPASNERYAYPELAGDLEAVLSTEARGRRAVVGGHSMGAHTTVAYALEHANDLAGLVLIGPSYAGVSPDAEELANWTALADGLEDAGIDGFLEAYERQGLAPEWRETLLRVARERLERHEHPDAVAKALRQVPRSAPFESLAELELLDVPALVVASHDEADPGHPHSVAEAYAERLPAARLISEEPGNSPLAWQGGRLSREIAMFCAEPEVVDRR